MTIKHKETVQRYARQHSQLIDMLATLSHFAATMPAPDENGDIPGVDYGYTGDVSRICVLLSEAADIAYHRSE